MKLKIVLGSQSTLIGRTAEGASQLKVKSNEQRGKTHISHHLTTSLVFDANSSISKEASVSRVENNNGCFRRTRFDVAMWQRPS